LAKTNYPCKSGACQKTTFASVLSICFDDVIFFITPEAEHVKPMNSAFYEFIESGRSRPENGLFFDTIPEVSNV